MKKKIWGVDKLALALFVFLLSFYVVLKVVNRLVYSGFMFSKLHVQPDLFIWPVIISMLPVAVIWIPRINFRKLLNVQSILIMFVFLIIAQNLRYIYKSEWQPVSFILAHPVATYEDKMRKVIGDLTYNYALFIVKYTPENASLLIPPQAFPWPASGNASYFRYFVYPRNLTSGNEFEPPSKDVLGKTDYVLLSWGETDTVESPHTHDWPKFGVKAEKIIFMNKDGTHGGEVKGDFHYSEYKGKKVWGLIVVKH